MILFKAILVLPGMVLALPSSPSPSINTDQNLPTSNYTFSSSSPLSPTRSSVSVSPSATLDTFVQSITGTPADLGIPKLTAADIEFVLVELPQILSAEAEADPFIERRASNWSGGTVFDVEGPASAEKWNKWQMDKWLQWYVENANAWGTSTKLVDSNKFLEDFWHSTGEEQQNPCDSLAIGGACIAQQPAAGEFYAGLDKDTRYRAYIARQAIANWRNGIVNSYHQLTWSAIGTQTTITALRNLFTSPKAPPPGDPMDILLPALGAVTIIFPELAPVSAAVGGVIALSKLVGRDIPTETVLMPNDTSPLFSSSSSDDDRLKDAPEFGGMKKGTSGKYFHRRQETYAGAVETAIDLHILSGRIKVVEDTIKTPTFFQQYSKSLEKPIGLLDKAVHVAMGIKALHPALPSLKVDTWSAFDLRVNQMLTLYPAAVEKSFDYTRKTWGPRKTEDGEVFAMGMGSILAGGQWFAYQNSATTVTKITTDLQEFFRKLVLSETLKQQSFYFTRQYFASNSDCQAAMVRQKDFMDSQSAWCVGGGTGNKTWQLRSARLPLVDKSDERSPGNLGKLLLGGVYDWVTRIPPVDQRPNYQDLGDYRDGSGYRNLQQGILNQALLGSLGPQQIFDFADKCQTAEGYPFVDVWPPQRYRFYPKMTLAGNPITDDKISTEPRCLFSMPIFELDKEESKDWCRKNIGSRSLPKPPNWWTFIDPYDKPCGNYKEFIAGAEAILCSLINWPTSYSWPGCELHDNGLWNK